MGEEVGQFVWEESDAWVVVVPVAVEDAAGAAGLRFVC
jgi:hypothetical protein